MKTNRAFSGKSRRFLKSGWDTFRSVSMLLRCREAKPRRVKLATELSKRDTGKTFYILDEPTTGLHFQDIAHLLDVLQKLVNKSNTVLVIEHNLDIIKSSDYIIDLGPEGGEKGGRIIAKGTPEEVSKNPASYTGMFLKSELN